MKNVLIAVDDSLGSGKVVSTVLSLYACTRPEKVNLVYVEKIEGRSLMDEMLGEAEMKTLKDSLKDTDYQKMLDKRASMVLDHYEKELAGGGVANVNRIIRKGHPADEILAAAKDEGAELIVVGSKAERLHTLLMGSVSREVANRAEVPVLLAK